MKTTIINNQIKLVDAFSQVVLTLNIPARNLSKMIEVTGAKIIAKHVVELTNRHYAGIVYATKLRVNYSKIEPFLNTSSIYECENKSLYLSMLADQNNIHLVNLKSEKVSLYAFGECHVYTKENFNVVYFDKSGRKLSLVRNDTNGVGKKRYIKFKGTWFSNRSF